jgi:hypothetical protein
MIPAVIPMITPAAATALAISLRGRGGRQVPWRGRARLLTGSHRGASHRVMILPRQGARLVVVVAGRVVLVVFGVDFGFVTAGSVGGVVPVFEPVGHV